MGVTKAKVWKAAEQLRGKGVKPTLAAVREELGGGSFSTISPALREWKARQALGPEASAEAVPEEVEQCGREATQSIWRLAARLAAERLAGERAALAERRQAADEELAEAAALADRLVVESDRLRAQCKQLEARLADSEERVAAIRAECREALGKARRSELAAREEAACLRGSEAACKEHLARLLASLGGSQAED